MAPSSVLMKGKLKTKAKGKAKAKGRGKGNKVMKAVRDAEDHDGDAPMVDKKPKALPLKVQVLRCLEAMSFDQAIAERKQIGAKLDEKIAQRSKVDDAAAKKVDDAQRHFAEVQAEVAAAEEGELEAMSAYKSFAATRTDAAKAKEDASNELLEATRALALIEVLAENSQNLKELEEKRRAAAEASEAAKLRLVEQKAAEREAMEATRKALTEQKAKALAEKEALKPPRQEEQEDKQVNGTASRRSADLD